MALTIPNSKLSNKSKQNFKIFYLKDYHIQRFVVWYGRNGAPKFKSPQWVRFNCHSFWRWCMYNKFKKIWKLIAIFLLTFTFCLHVFYFQMNKGSPYLHASPKKSVAIHIHDGNKQCIYCPQTNHWITVYTFNIFMLPHLTCHFCIYTNC